MTKTMSKKEQIIEAAVEILLEGGEKGKQYSELMELLKTKFPDFPPNTIHGTAWRLHKEREEIKKVARGHFIHKTFLSFDDMEGDGSSSLSDFLNRKEYNIIIEFLEEFKVDFETVGIKELRELNDEAYEKFSFLLKASTLLTSTEE